MDRVNDVSVSIGSPPPYWKESTAVILYIRLELVSIVKCHKNTIIDMKYKLKNYMENKMIQLIKREQLQECLDILKQGYEHTALTYGMTEENCPYRGRTCLPYEVFEDEFDRGYLMYGYILGNKIVGFLSLYKEENILHINDIVILPEYQNKGFGSRLMQYAKEKAMESDCSKLALGMVRDNVKLKEWYEKEGFHTVEVIKFESVSYMVGNMEKSIKRRQ